MHIPGVNQYGSTTPPAGRRGAAELRSGTERLARHARELNAYATEGMRTPSNTEDTELSSRTVSWMESIKTHFKKIKHRIIIAVCNMRLHCHFYIDDDTRRELKRSVRESERELKILDSEQQRKYHFNQLREELEDGRIREAATHALQAGRQGVLELFHKFQKEVDIGENQ